MKDRLEILRGRAERLPTATGPTLRRLLTDLADAALT
ncbi:hypothetical protein, partial [Frankia sp. CpI1-P]